MITFAQRRDPCVSAFGKVMSVFKRASGGPSANNVNVAIRPNYPGLPSSTKGTVGEISRRVKNLWLTTDSSDLKELDPVILEPIARADQTKLHPLLKGPLSCGIHLLDMFLITI